MKFQTNEEKYEEEEEEALRRKEIGDSVFIHYTYYMK